MSLIKQIISQIISFRPMSPPVMTASMGRVVAKIANHVLSRETWARDHLRPFAGYQFIVQIAKLKHLFIIEENGTLRAQSPALEHVSNSLEGKDSRINRAVQQTEDKPIDADVVITLPAKTLCRSILSGSSNTLHLRGMDIQGDAQCAKALSTVLENSRWDIEEDLSMLVGDTLAHRAMRYRDAGQHFVKKQIRRLAESVADYGLDERPSMIRHSALHGFTCTLHPLQAAVENLEKRIAQLEKK